MELLNKLERIFGRFAIAHLTLYIVAGQVGCFVLGFFDQEWISIFALIPDRVLSGEVWRLVTFMLMPPSWSPIWVVFALYLFYLMGNALESEWGEFRYNFFILVGWFATVAVSFIFPGNFSTNSYVLGSVFLAFAYLYPDFVIHLFFILPIKIKWLALIAWAGYGLTLIMGGWLDRLLVVAAIFNFLLFFGKDILLTMKSRKRRMEFDARKLRDDSLPFHSCTVCGITDKQAPDMDFRVCAECSGDHEYCAQHIHDHPHKT